MVMSLPDFAFSQYSIPAAAGRILTGALFVEIAG